MEYRSEQIALQVLQEKSSRGQDFSLTRDDVQNLGMICGGACDVYFHYIPEGDTCICDLVQKAESFFEENRDLWMVSDIGDGGKLSLADKKDTTLAKYLTRHPCRVQENGKNL